jgi:hypothetical protein
MDSGALFADVEEVLTPFKSYFTAVQRVIAHDQEAFTCVKDFLNGSRNFHA